MLTYLLEMFQELGVLYLGTWWMLKVPDQNSEDRVILNVMDDLILSKERYPESFMLISLLEAWQEVVVLHWCTWMTLRVSRLEDRVLPDAMNDLIFPKEVTTKVSC